MDEGAAPSERYFVFIQIVEESSIPHESIGEGLLVLKAEGEGEVVLIGEVESCLEYDVVFSNLAVDFLSLGPSLERTLVSVPQEE